MLERNGAEHNSVIRGPVVRAKSQAVNWESFLGAGEGKAVPTLYPQHWPETKNVHSAPPPPARKSCPAAPPKTRGWGVSQVRLFISPFLELGAKSGRGSESIV